MPASASNKTAFLSLWRSGGGPATGADVDLVPGQPVANGTPVKVGASGNVSFFFFFFNDTATTEIYTLSLHDALPIFHSLDPHRVLDSRPASEVGPFSQPWKAGTIGGVSVT